MSLNIRPGTEFDNVIQGNQIIIKNHLIEEILAGLAHRIGRA